MGSGGLILEQMPGWLPQPDSFLTAGTGINGLAFSRMQMNADFAATGFEVFYSEMVDGGTLELPQSMVTGYQYSASEIINYWEFRSTVRDITGIPLANGGMLICNLWVDPYSLAVSSGINYLVQGGANTPERDGRLACWQICQRGRGLLASPGYTPVYSYLADSAFGSSPALTQALVQQLNDNAMAAASRKEAFTDCGTGTAWQAGYGVAEGYQVKPTIYHANGCYYTALTNGTTGDVEPAWPSQLGSIFWDGSVLWDCTGQGFQNGQTFALPTSWDGHTYLASEFVGGLCSWITTGQPNGTGPSGSGRLQRLQKSINSSRLVSTTVTYWDGNVQNIGNNAGLGPNDGLVNVVGFFQRAVAAQPSEPPPYNVMQGNEFMSGSVVTAASGAKLLEDLNENINNAIARPTFFLESAVASGSAPALPTDPVILYPYARSECFNIYALDDTGAATGDQALRLFQTTLDPGSGLVTLRVDYNTGGGQVTSTNGFLDVITVAARASYVMLNGVAVLNLTGSAVITPMGGGNIIPNGGFNTWNTLLKTTSQVVAIPAGWTESNSTQDGYTTSWQPGNVGPYMVGLNVGNAHAPAYNQYVSLLSYPVGVASGNLYSWQIWAKANPTISTGLRFRIHFRDINFANDVYFDLVPLQGQGTSWVKFSGQFTIPQPGDTVVTATGAQKTLSGAAPAQLTYIYAEIWNYEPNVSSTIYFGLVDIENQTPAASLVTTAANIVDVNGNAYNPLVASASTIVVSPFWYQSGGVLVPCLQTGAYTIAGLTNNTAYLVGFLDPSLRGGAITPIATTNMNYGQSNPGWVPIGTISTTTPGSGGGGVIYRPTTYSDIGMLSTQNPTLAYDGNTATYAELQGLNTGGGPHTGGNSDCQWKGIPDWPSTPTSPVLNIYSSHNTSLSNAIIRYSLNSGSTWTNVRNSSATWNATSTPDTVALLSTQHWNTIWVEAISTVPGSAGDDIMEVFEVYISATL